MAAAVWRPGRGAGERRGLHISYPAVEGEAWRVDGGDVSGSQGADPRGRAWEQERQSEAGEGSARQIRARKGLDVGGAAFVVWPRTSAVVLMYCCCYGGGGCGCYLFLFVGVGR